MSFLHFGEKVTLSEKCPTMKSCQPLLSVHSPENALIHLIITIIVTAMVIIVMMVMIVMMVILINLGVCCYETIKSFFSQGNSVAPSNAKKLRFCLIIMIWRGVL